MSYDHGDTQSYNTDTGNFSKIELRPVEDPRGHYMGAPAQNTSITPLISSTSIAATTREMVFESSNHVLAYVLVPLGSLAVIILLSFLIMFLLRKSRMDRLRHHLMPLYNFDPMEEEGDWESELLEEEKEQTMALNMKSSSQRGPKLKFHHDV